MRLTRTQWYWFSFLLSGLSLYALYQGGKAERISGGLASGRRRSDFDRRELARGRRVEMEHTDDPAIAEEIAMDHLVEDPRYYSKLLAAGL